MNNLNYIQVAFFTFNILILNIFIVTIKYNIFNLTYILNFKTKIRGVNYGI